MPQGRGRLLTFLEDIALFSVGMTSGAIAAAGTFAFIVMIGIFTRLADRTHTSSYVSVYENAIVLGGTIGNIVLIYNVNLPLSYVGLAVFGVFCGVFVGCLAVALAEVLKVFPVLSRRLALICGLPYIVLSIALGKGVGSFIQFIFGWA